MSFDPRIVKHPDEDLRFIKVFVVMNPQVIFAYSIPKVHNSRLKTLQPDALIPLCPKDQRLTLFKEQGLHWLGTLFGKDLKSPVIEDITVLIDLEKGGPPVGLAAKQHLLQMFRVPVHGAGYKARISPHSKCKGIERMIDAAEWCRLGDLPFLRGGRILPLGQPIDLVVKQQDVQVEIAAQQMDSVIPPNTETIPVARDDPDAQLGTAGLQPRSDSRSTPMDRMHAIGIHIIGKTAATTYPRNNNDVLPGYSQGRHNFLHLGEDDIIPASRAPADLLVCSKIFCRQGLWWDGSCFTHGKIAPCNRMRPQIY